LRFGRGAGAMLALLATPAPKARIIFAIASVYPGNLPNAEEGF
jgi:hypothetical protein